MVRLGTGRQGVTYMGYWSVLAAVGLAVLLLSAFLGRDLLYLRVWKGIRERYQRQIDYLRNTSFPTGEYRPTSDDIRLLESKAIIQVERHLQSSTWVWHKPGQLERYGCRRLRLLNLTVGQGWAFSGEFVRFVVVRGKNRHSHKEFRMFVDASPA